MSYFEDVINHVRFDETFISSVLELMGELVIAYDVLALLRFQKASVSVDQARAYINLTDTLKSMLSMENESMCSELFTSINRGLSGAGNKENILRTTDRNNFIGKLIKPMDQSAVDLLYCPAYYVDSDDPVFMISQAVILTALYEPFTVYNIASACLVATYLLAKNGYGYCRISKYSYDYIKDAMSKGDQGSATEHLRDVCFTKITFKE